ncbi:small conductance mechanosensitive channel [Alteribacillus persepolensis]|uniref:Small conductance mechanosensitive channel n=1 Tax=Alteribacillus persepolensis TaxID=568899 RepID=A0A1G7Y8L8_9BACI|nr:mechanosensitive ion channel family protein [Alteribacillus persepolensis]SDG92724.1 small conductance mechanosensitive channel [Alteribacillus persepolensis]
MGQVMENAFWGTFIGGAILIILQILFVMIGFFIVRAIGKNLINRGFTKLKEQKNMHPGRMQTLLKLSTNVFSYVLIFIFITIIIGIFGLDIAPLIAGAGIVGLAIGFGAQGLVSDVVTGFFILLEKQIDVEDYVTVAGVDGVVEEVGLRTTQVRGFDGTLHFIPNREISTVNNHSRGNMRAMIDMRISYNDNVDKAIQVLQSVCDTFAKEEPAMKEGPDVLGVQAFGQSDVVIRILGKTDNMEQWGVERKLRQACKEALEQNGIEIPYPHQVYIEKKQQA